MKWHPITCEDCGGEGFTKRNGRKGSPYPFGLCHLCHCRMLYGTAMELCNLSKPPKRPRRIGSPALGGSWGTPQDAENQGRSSEGIHIRRGK